MNAKALIRGLAYRAAWYMTWVLCKVYFRYTSRGKACIPRKGPVILAANHASFLDPLWLALTTRRRIRYFMHGAYYRSWAWPLFWILGCIPVDTSNAGVALRRGLRVLKEGGVIGIFPEGHVSPNGQLQPARAGALLLAKRSGVPVVPVALKGNARAFSREAHLPRPRKVVSLVGEALRVPTDASRVEMRDITRSMMATIRGMLAFKEARA